MRIRKYYPTVVLSDIHLGSDYSRTVEVTNFLKNINCGPIPQSAGWSVLPPWSKMNKGNGKLLFIIKRNMKQRMPVRLFIRR